MRKKNILCILLSIIMMCVFVMPTTAEDDVGYTQPDFTCCEYPQIEKLKHVGNAETQSSCPVNCAFIARDAVYLGSKTMGFFCVTCQTNSTWTIRYFREDTFCGVCLRIFSSMFFQHYAFACHRP
jgi:hypothetical protein